MKEVYFNARSNFFCAVDHRPASPTHGKIIGIVGAQALGEDPYGAHPNEPVLELRRMSVHNGARKLGLGTKLVAVLEEHARCHGIQVGATAFEHASSAPCL
jgi:GNAT superfamily N-acetyltransferase